MRRNKRFKESDKMKLTNMILSTIAVLILLMAVAIPIIGSMQNSTMTPVYSDNEIGEGSYKMAKATTWTFSAEKAAGGATSGGEQIPVGFVIVSDTFSCQVTSSGLMCQAMSSDRLSQVAPDTLTISGNRWTMYDESDDLTYTNTFSWIFYPSEAGTYMKAVAPVNVDDRSEIVTYGYSTAEGRAVLKGSIASGMSVVFSSYAVTNMAVNATESGYTNVLESVSFHTGNSTDVTDTNNLIVPIKYTTDMTSDNVLSSIVSFIPVILVVALLIGIVGQVVFKRFGDDY